MASFPENEYSPREIENEPGVVYDANNKRTFFAEDLNATNDEIVAIENALRPNPTKPLPYGLKIGNEDSDLTIEEWVLGPVKGPCLSGRVAGAPVDNALVIKDTMVLLLPESGQGGIHFFHDDLSNGLDINVDLAGKIFQVNGSLILNRDDNNNFINLGGRDPVTQQWYAVQIATDGAEQSLKISGDVHLLAKLGVAQSIKAETTIEARNGFRVNAVDGTTQNVVVVVNVRMNGTALEKKTRTVTISGGIVTAVSDISDWQST